jgi:hypothetical protein
VVDLGHDEDGDPMTSCVVAFEDAPTSHARKRTAKLGPPEEITLRALSYLLDHGSSEPAPLAPGVRPGTLAVRREDLRSRAMASGFAGDDDKPDALRQRWKRALERLVALDRIRVEGDLVWPV